VEADYTNSLEAAVRTAVDRSFRWKGLPGRLRRRGVANLLGMGAASLRGAFIAAAELLVAPFVAAALALASLVRPLRVVRLRADRIGHLSQNTDIVLRKAYLEDGGRRRLMIGLVRSGVANRRLLDLFRRRLTIVEGTVRAWLLESVRRLPGAPFYADADDYSDDRCRYVDYHAAAPSIAFTPEEHDEGRRLLRAIGLSDGDWYVCVHARDPSYLAAHLPTQDWSYHNYRDCDIATYLDASRYIVRQGGWALRMGHTVDRALTVDEPRLIDYATRHRSEWGDVYIPSTCKFFLGCTGGLFLMAMTARRPVACANYYLEVLSLFSPGDLFIPKKLWSVERRRLLTFREALDSGAGRLTWTYQYEQAGLELIDNSADEIVDMAREMNERVDGTFAVTGEDEDLQRRFRALFKPHHLGYGSPVRIGAAFLRQHRALLD
jgi:putative glycosyltransferase (TIGR04372 family)